MQANKNNLGDVTFQPHVKAGDTKANTFLFQVGGGFKRNYLTLDEVKILLDEDYRANLIALMNQAIDKGLIRSKDEMLMESKVRKDIAKVESGKMGTIQMAQMQAMFAQTMQQMMQQMAAK